MTIPRSAAAVLSGHVSLEVECVDRMYLNLYVPKLQYESGVVGFLRGHAIASSALMAPMTRQFVSEIERFVTREGVDLVTFAKGQRKDDVAHDYLAGFGAEEGVLFVGKAQEKTTTFRTEKRRNAETGASYPWIVRTTAMVNQYYIYCVDRDFGPFFIKFSTYFPYNAKLCLCDVHTSIRRANLVRYLSPEGCREAGLRVHHSGPPLPNPRLYRPV